MTLPGAFFLGPITLLLLLISGTPLTIVNLPVYIAGGLGTTFWLVIASFAGTLFTGR